MGRLCCVLLLFLSQFAGAAGLDGRTVILIVAEHRIGDPDVAKMEGELNQIRESLGMSAQDMPLVVMGFADSDTERGYFDRLGFKAEDAPVICVAEWGNPARFGPKRVIGQAIVRHADSAHVAPVVNAYLEQMGFSNRVPVEAGITLSPLPAEPAFETVPGALEIGTVRFEVGGKSLFTTNMAVRVRNIDNRTLHNVKIRFYSRLAENSEWNLVDEKMVGKILAGNVVARDHIADTRKLGLVDANFNAVRCLYKVEVEHVGKVIEKVGEFVPLGSGI